VDKSKLLEKTEGLRTKGTAFSRAVDPVPGNRLLAAEVRFLSLCPICGGIGIALKQFNHVCRYRVLVGVIAFGPEVVLIVNAMIRALPSLEFLQFSLTV
jgi:hypothetical protein